MYFTEANVNMLFKPQRKKEQNNETTPLSLSRLIFEIFHLKRNFKIGLVSDFYATLDTPGLY